MGTMAEVKIVTSKNPDEAVAMAKRVVAEVENELSAFSTNSVVGRLNASAGRSEMRWEDELTSHAQVVFALSDTAVQWSGGAFDPTVGPLMDLWGFRGKQKLDRIPTEEEIQATLQRVGWDKLERRKRREYITNDLSIITGIKYWPEVRLAQEGMKLDFGAVAKGYAVDIAYGALMRRHCTNILVNLGGDMRGGGREWKVGIKDPYDSTGTKTLGTFILTDGRATATSGSYERFVEIDGKRYSHIIDARTGYPVEGVDQVTVIANTAGEADALATTLFILGREEGMKLLEATPGAEALFVEDGEIYASPAFPAIGDR